MNKKMLIDASYKEETRIVILDGNCIENYDVENSTKKQLKGNIYLAKVIRIEPSLQAAFVEYGGNRHGFLAFSEIHPDYYQIPIADRNKILELNKNSRNDLDDSQINDEASDDQQTTTINDDDDEVNQPITNIPKNYKIQEVVHRRQILLVQVVKEERGNKGAALTTYLSLAGRYCVLMPNSLRGGGISRKITSVAERRRLKDIINELSIPSHMGIIIRTAGAQCPKPDALKDGEYLLHLWDEIRERTMKAVAPSLIYEDSSLLKRAIRDIYTSDISEILIDGEEAWNIARDYMRALMPQNIRKLHLWRDQKHPLFFHYKVENLIDQMLSPTVQLKSGGYLVINQTEALVAIDVNSGRSIKEKDLEETALRTNQEAADEVVRQLRLRDLAGLIVIDFIDMENRKHNYMVEKRLKNALHKDRARIQVGSISSFGLLEMTRQRLRPSISEFSFIPCSHCNGTGIIRSIPSACLHILRQIDEEARKSKPGVLTVYTNSNDIAFYILNKKRSWLLDIENKYKIQVTLEIDTTLPNSQISFAHEVNEILEQEQEIEQEAEQEKTDFFLEQNSPYIREIPIQSESADAVDISEEKESYQQRKRRNNNNRRSRHNNYRQPKDEQPEILEPVEITQELNVPAITFSHQDDQPDISFHPVVNQDEYFASKKEDQPKRSNRYPRQPRWKRNKYQQSNIENNEQEASENISSVSTIDIIPITETDPTPLVTTLKINSDKSESPAFVAIDITDKKIEGQEATNISSPQGLTNIAEPIIKDNNKTTDDKPAKRTRKTTKTSRVSKGKEGSITTKKKAEEALGIKSNISESVEVVSSEQAEEKPIKKTTRGRKATTTKKTEIKTSEAKVKKPTAKKPATRKKNPANSGATEQLGGEKQAPAIQPIVIDDTAPAPTPRAGWWKR